MLVGRAVHRIGRGAVVEQVAGVQRAPLPIRPLRAVGDDQMGVQQRITGPPGAVGEPHRQQPRPLHMLGEGVQDRHVLVRAEHQIPGRHRVLPWRAAELLTRPGVLPGEQPLERLGRTLTLKPQGAGAAAVVDARGLAVAGQVLLTVLGDLTGLPRRRALAVVSPPRSPG
jgi:hypothetical protein